MKIDPYVTFDLTLGYDFGFDEPLLGALKNVRISATAQNLFDRDPPLVITSNSVFNAAYSNPFWPDVYTRIAADDAVLTAPNCSTRSRRGSPLPLRRRSGGTGNFV